MIALNVKTDKVYLLGYESITLIVMDGASQELR